MSAVAWIIRKLSWKEKYFAKLIDLIKKIYYKNLFGKVGGPGTGVSPTAWIFSWLPETRLFF